ncbi:MAG: hypothetical protein QG666_1371 [Euryarchaeota archaeon]|nr:hypothetical protein [Euryarchaeota archaeon]
MTMAKENDDDHRQEFPERLRRILIEMEENDERDRPFSGSIAYSGIIRADYRIRLQMGFGDKNRSMNNPEEI